MIDSLAFIGMPVFDPVLVLWFLGSFICAIGSIVMGIVFLLRALISQKIDSVNIVLACCVFGFTGTAILLTIFMLGLNGLVVYTRISTGLTFGSPIIMSMICGMVWAIQSFFIRSNSPI